MRIRITVNGAVMSGLLQANPTGKDFAALLPLTLELSDYNATEKIAQLPGKLSTAGAPDGFTPTVGDIAFYAPWGNLAIFYKDFAYSHGLVKLGKIEGDTAPLKAAAPQKVLIELDQGK